MRRGYIRAHLKLSRPHNKISHYTWASLPSPLYFCALDVSSEWSSRVKVCDFQLYPVTDPLFKSTARWPTPCPVIRRNYRPGAASLFVLVPLYSHLSESFETILYGSFATRVRSTSASQR